MGHVIQAGAGQITARQAAVNGGIPMNVPALTVNKVCLSGLAEIGARGNVAGPDASLLSQPANAIAKALGAKASRLPTSISSR